MAHRRSTQRPRRAPAPAAVTPRPAPATPPAPSAPKGAALRHAPSLAFAVVVLAIATIIGLRTRQRPAVATAPAAAPARARSSPGDVRWRFRVLPLPAGLVTPDQCDMVQADWVLPGYSRAQFDGLLDSIAPAPATRARLEAAVRCDASGCTIHPSRELIEDMRPATRRALYANLSRQPGMESFARHIPAAARQLLRALEAHPLPRLQRIVRRLAR